MSGIFEQAKAFFVQGIGDYQAGRFDAAETAFTASLSLLPGRASTLANLGATRLKLGRPEEALDLLDEALAKQPDDIEALGHRATALAELDRHPPALACVDRILALDAGRGEAWSLRGRLLRDLGRDSEAIAALEQALAHGADNALNRYFLAGLKGKDAPDAPPPRYVQGLFDNYAAQYDQHLVQVLSYSAPQVLVAGLGQRGQPYVSALDLGCGTGLCGPLLRPRVTWLEGVDLSANMLERAAALGVYDELVQADLVAHLGTTERRHDLVVAADVFIYVGELAPVFEGVARVLEVGGSFCFSVEEATGDHDLVLLPSLRYAHSERMVRALGGRFGFEIAACNRQAIREHQGVPVPGLFTWLVRR